MSPTRIEHKHTQEQKVIVPRILLPVAQLAPQQAVMARAPTALPSAIQAGLATPVKPSAVAAGGRKMLQSAPDCCNTYTIQSGDTLDSIAAAYGQPTNGARIMQVRSIRAAMCSLLSLLDLAFFRVFDHISFQGPLF